MPTEFVPKQMWHPKREGYRRAGTPTQFVQLKADGWRERKPVAMTTKTTKTKK